MASNPPPIQEPVSNETKLFTRVWVRWLNGIFSFVNRHEVVASKSASQVIDYSSFNWFGDTDNGAVTFTLPAGVAGQSFRIVNTGTNGNSLTITPNGSENLIGANSSFVLNDGEALVIYYDENKGWY